MTKQSLETAVAEASRFRTIANKALKRIREDRFALVSGSKETAAAKRASLDLSRALTEMRKAK